MTTPKEKKTYTISMFNKKKGGNKKILSFAESEDKKPASVPKKRKLNISEEQPKPLSTKPKQVVEIDDIDLSKYTNDPLLTSTNNIDFLKQIMRNQNSLVSNIDKSITDEDKTIVNILSSVKNYLPTENKHHVTLTYAQSLDSKIGYRFKKTAISHIETKQMTHFLRYHHDGIVVGFNTFVEDNPNLNFKYYQNTMSYFIKKDDKKIIPIILDPKLKIKEYIKQNKDVNLKTNYENGSGAKSIFVCLQSHLKNIEEPWMEVLAVPDEIYYTMEKLFLHINEKLPHIKSFMVEGGATIINKMVEQNNNKEFIDTTILTIAPIYLGSEGVSVTPTINEKHTLNNVEWVKGSNDSVLLSKR